LDGLTAKQRKNLKKKQ